MSSQEAEGKAELNRTFCCGPTTCQMCRRERGRVSGQVQRELQCQSFNDPIFVLGTSLWIERSGRLTNKTHQFCTCDTSDFHSRTRVEKKNERAEAVYPGAPWFSRYWKCLCSQIHWLRPVMICQGFLRLRWTVRVVEDKSLDFCQVVSVEYPKSNSFLLLDVVTQKPGTIESQGVIRQVDGSTKWCSALIIAPKSSGGYHLCFNTAKLNQVILREHYVLPTIDEILGYLDGAIIFSKLDAMSSFHRVRLYREREEMMTFITPSGRYRYRQLPFTNAAAVEFLQCQISAILEGLSGIVNMSDNLLVFGKDQWRHDQRLKEVLQCLNQTSITINEHKYTLRVTQVRLLVSSYISLRSYQSHTTSKPSRSCCHLQMSWEFAVL